MECRWDTALLQCGDQLPTELLEIIQHGSNQQYLDAITRHSLDPRYTYTLMAHCEDILAHVCASLRSYGSFASSIGTLGRVVPFVPYLIPYAEQLLAREHYDFAASSGKDEDLLYLLGLFRLLAYDWRVFKKYVKPAEMSALLSSPSRPVIYLAIRILQIYLSGADHWFEQMIKRWLGEDTPTDGIDGQWDDKTIDYRFLTLWEEQRLSSMRTLINEAKSRWSRPLVKTSRIIPQEDFDSATALVGGILLPREPAVRSANKALVLSQTTVNNLQKLATALRSPQPVLLTGLAGSGKTTLVREVARSLGKLDTMVTLHLNEQSDAKLLIGIYTTGETSGSFAWQPGVLTKAVQEGRWVLIEDLDRAPSEIIGALLPLIENRELYIANRKQTISAAQGFRIFGTIRSTTNHRGEDIQPRGHVLGARHWQHVTIVMQPVAELKEITSHLYPQLSVLLTQFMAVYARVQVLRQSKTLVRQSRTGVLRAISPRDLLKWCKRVTRSLRDKTSFTSNDMDDIFLEAIDCFVGALPDGLARSDVVAALAEELRIDPQRRDYLLIDRDVRYEADNSRVIVGRYSLARVNRSKEARAARSQFATTPHTSRMLERVIAATVNSEPLLLVGETGVGKTAAVQHLAVRLGKRLIAFNLSQQSDASDLLGGFKPVSARSLVVPLKDEFDDLFTASFSPTKNRQFLELLGKQMAASNWKAVCKIWHQALKMVDQQRSISASRQGEAPSKKRKVDASKILDFARWDAFAVKVKDVEHRIASGSDNFAFSFVEGSIVKAVRAGDWVLLDEINLASPDTLESIADLLSPTEPSLLLTESGDIERIDAHPDFRIFAAMNPATDVGKKDLPPGIRSRFTELYVESPDKDFKSLQSIVRLYLRHDAVADQAIAMDASTLYQKIIALAEQNKLVDGAGQRPHFSLRTLTRTLSFAQNIAPRCSLRRALYEGFQMSFMTVLDMDSARIVQPLLEQHLFNKRYNIHAELRKPLRKPSDGRYVQGFPGSKHWVPQGNRDVEEQPQYILTPFIRSNLENLARATSTRQFPVLIQGPTSSGKTSMIEYLAGRTGHEFVRINNHEHTDVQEYLGTYVSDTDGRLQFQEGVLIRALREGHWLVLDELNLAPTDVLEALNRLLDDNRELLVPETQEVVRPHESFMLFATQNPAGVYGGRKPLSRAFRNRFLELHFDDIPVDELQEILHRRTQLPESRCKRIVTVYRELSGLRQESRLFEQRSFATLRDLFRWALRPNDTIEQLAANGFMLLAERVRKAEERQILKGIIERVMSSNGPRVSIDEAALYSPDQNEILQHIKSAGHQGVIWTKAMRRLYVLVSRAIQNNEPVLLVGETGCGKTTVCQMLANALGQELHTVNAHQNTETGDLVGSQRPVRNRAVIEADLRHQLLSSPLLQGLETAAAHSTDALLDLYDRTVASLTSPEKKIYIQSTLSTNIQASRTRFKALFEWSDGSLVVAMKTGAFFLLDEISLADDSVLERINSVLEPQRSVLLAEKGSVDSSVVAAPGFQFFATMNPGGDYGKRELSPALRNRFTEIWVPSLNDVQDIAEIASAKLMESARLYAPAIVAFAQWFRARYNTSASSSVSIRDTLAWVQFVNNFPDGDVAAAVVHGAAMVYIDALGANPAGLMNMTTGNLDHERAECLTELGRLMETDANAIYSAPINLSFTDSKLAVGAFSVPSSRSFAGGLSTFSFDPPTTRVNAMRVVRALQLSKPVLLEGSPGVGKTALVTAIADAVGMPLTRINLSDQTDLIDLFGSDVPNTNAEMGTFAWRDAPFLRAMKRGEWVLLDEMNLASQSVLEGLNACLDHRGEVFVPELGQTFSRHPDFRLFAAQNPHHQGGGRKGLPTSFVNRFTVVFADAFRSEDLALISRRSFPELDADIIDKAISFIDELERHVVQFRRVGANGGPWEFNLRDLFRWLSLVSSHEGLLRSGTHKDFVDFLFMQRFRSASDRTFVADLFSRSFGDTLSASELFLSISSQMLQLGLGVLPRDLSSAIPARLQQWRPSAGSHLRVLQPIMLCVQQNWPCILTGSSGAGKTAVIARLAAAVGSSVVTIAMNAETDALDLIGGYDQSDPQQQLAGVLDQIRGSVTSRARANLINGTCPELLDMIEDCHSRTTSDATHLGDLIGSLGSRSLYEEQTRLESVQQHTHALDKARFEWLDGPLIEALQEGHWFVLDNANLCSPSVLDRLNSLLEPDGTLVVNEHTYDDGSPHVIRPHPGFRIFLTLDPKHGELSRAMRNRAVEIHLDPMDETAADDSSSLLHTESVVSRLRQTSVLVTGQERGVSAAGLAAVLADHMTIADQTLLPRFERQLHAGLFAPAKQDAKSFSVTSSESPWLLLGCSDRLESLYRGILDRMQLPTDVASVQTLHPLNNQALIQSSPQASSDAFTLALSYELVASLSLLRKALASVEKLPSVMTKLWRLEQSRDQRSQTVTSVAKYSVLVASLKQSIQQLLGSLRKGLGELEVNGPAFTKVINRLCPFWTLFLETANNDRLDSASLASFLHVGQSILRQCIDCPSEVSVPLAGISRAVSSVISHLGGNDRGRASSALWRALRPIIPTTVEQLNGLLSLESVIARFDHMCQHFEYPLGAMTDVRLSFSRALSLAQGDIQNVTELSKTLEQMILDTHHGTTAFAADKPPHFSQSFNRLFERFSLLSLEGCSVPLVELGRLEILAQRQTKAGITHALNPHIGRAQKQFRLLSSTISRLLSAGPDAEASTSFVRTLLPECRSIQNVSLGRLGLLEDEKQAIGRLISSQAHQVCSDESPSLRSTLRGLLLDVLNALSSSTDDGQVQELAQYLAGLLDGSDFSDGTEAVLAMHRPLVDHDFTLKQVLEMFETVVDYLRTSPDTQRLDEQRAANAWVSFATACLQLYVPGMPLDPALEGQLRQETHRVQYRYYSSRLFALRWLRQTLYGHPESLRSRSVEHALSGLGKEPLPDEICRPEESRFADLKEDLDALMHLLDPILQTGGDCTTCLPFSATVLGNLGNIRSRLANQYRAYDDFVCPVIGFVDCLLTGHRLAVEARASALRQFTCQGLASILPYVGASFDTWLLDQTFVSAGPHDSTQAEQLCWLEVVAMRSCIWPMAKCSLSFRRHVELRFHQFYLQWKSELSQDQTAAATKSSLYRYKGEVEQEDDLAAEEIEQLFPSTQQSSATGSSTSSVCRVRDLSHVVARLHQRVFMPQPADNDLVRQLLRQWQVIDPKGHEVADADMLPTIILALENVHTSSASGFGMQHYNMYTDANTVEVRKLSTLVTNITGRFKHIQHDWPEHATPTEVLQLCASILTTSHASPLSRFLPSIEKLHATMYEWQKIASREFSVNELFGEVTSLIIRWRQLELSTWAALFDREWEQCEKDAASWWFIAYEAIFAATSLSLDSTRDLGQHTQELLSAIEGFLSASCLGEFSARLQILRSFHAHLAAREIGEAHVISVRQGIANLVKFYAHFEQNVADKLSNGRASLNNEVKNIIKLASWKDRNIHVLRQSAQSSHRRLLRLVRKYRVLVAEPVTSLLHSGVQAKVAGGVNVSEPILAARKDVTPVAFVDLSGVQSWKDRPDRYRNVSATVGLISKKRVQWSKAIDVSQRLESYSIELGESVAELQRSTPSVLTEENKTLASHLKTRKRRLLADVLKDVRSMGFPSSVSEQVLQQQDSMSSVFARLPAILGGVTHLNIEHVESQFHRLLGVMPAVREAVRKHSPDLTAAESARCVSLLESMLQMSVDQHRSVALQIALSTNVQRALDAMNDFAQSDRPRVKPDLHCILSTLINQLACLKPMLNFCSLCLRAQQRMSGGDYSEVLQALEGKATTLSQLTEDAQSLPRLPSNIVTGETDMFADRFTALVNGLTVVVETAVASHPELQPVMSQLLRWTAPTMDKASPAINGHVGRSVDEWARYFIQTLDIILGAVQDAEDIVVSSQNQTNKAWVSDKQKIMNRTIAALRVELITRSIFELTERLQYCDIEEDGMVLVAAMWRSVFPIVDSYRQTVTYLVASSCNFYGQISRTAYGLATHFLRIANQGFCSPPERAQDSKDQSNGVESGTGLGEGEGGEDLSKDIADDEDLSELAQDARREEQRGEMEDEKDAVDMADEEMEGDVGDVAIGSEDEQDDGSGELDEAAEQEEEPGDLGSTEPTAVDEKVWDGAEDKEQQQKKADSGKGSATENELEAGQEGSFKDHSTTNEDDNLKEAEAQDAKAQEVEQADDSGLEELEDRLPERLDPHLEEQSNLELPEDLQVDGHQAAEDNDSVTSDFSADQHSEREVTADAEADEETGVHQDDHEVAGEAKEEGDKSEAPHDEADNTENGDQGETSDTLMQEQQPIDADDPEDSNIAAEEGVGPDQGQVNGKASRSHLAPEEMADDKPANQDDQSQGGTLGGHSREHEGKSSIPQHERDDRQTLPFKQLGDILEQWYNQHRKIQDAQQDAEPSQQQDIEMGEMEFEHLPNDEAVADTQALGATSTEHSKALDDSKALSVTEDDDVQHAELDDTAQVQEQRCKDPTEEESMQLDKSDTHNGAGQPDIVIGHPNDDAADIEMNDQPRDTATDSVDDVDKQFLNTHISHELGDGELSLNEARSLWSQHEQSTRNLSLVLTEHLRLILQPTQATKMRGDFRTGKRLNIKRIIPYIASSYKRDKIWMRRSVPSKRSYQIMLAIDDSKSMTESHSRIMAFDTLAMVARSLSMLEVGELCVVNFGNSVKIAHEFHMPFTSETGAATFRQFSFSQGKTDVRELLNQSIELFRAARSRASSSASDLWQLQLIISDGICEDHPSIRQLVRQAHEERIMVVFIVVDAAAGDAQTSHGPKQSILDLQTAEFVKDTSGEMQLNMVKYLDTFPFRYYLIVRDVQELPAVLAGALRQWFSEVAETNG